MMARSGSKALTEAELASFNDQGYLMVEGLLSESELAPLRSDYARVLDRLCTDLQQAGEITSSYADLPFAERYLEVCKESGKVYGQHFNIVLPPNDTVSDTPVCHTDSVFNILINTTILDAVESIVGPEIALSPVGNVRVKPPARLITRVEGDFRHGTYRQAPWHQDNGVVTADADDTEMTTVWFALTDATVEAGCLQVIPGSHRVGLLDHCPKTGELIIPDALLPDREPAAVPMKPGDVLFLHRRMVHRSLSNVGNTVRWSFDLRYQPAGRPTGREALPSFLVRSRAQPDAVVRGSDQWRRAWQQARERLIGGDVPAKWNRWSADAAMCA